MIETKSHNKFAVWLATGLGVGLITPAPGTIGGLWGLPLVWAISLIPTTSAQAVALLLICLASVPICTAAARSLGGKKDPGAIVLDEIAALPIVFLAVDTNNWSLNWSVVLAGWMLFRLFDILKPPPIPWFERLPNGWGIMADDCLAAALAAVVLLILLKIDQAAQLHFFLTA